MSRSIDRPSLLDIENRLCDLIAEQIGVARTRLHPDLAIIQDLGIDSLELVELMMNVEETFDITIPDDPDDPVVKQVFTRVPVRIRDLAEVVHLRSLSVCRRAPAVVPPSSPPPRRVAGRPAGGGPAAGPGARPPRAGG